MMHVNPGEFGNAVLPDMRVVSWLGMTPRHIDCHVYALRGSDGILLIDCGTTWGHERICRNLAHWGLSIADVRTVLCTHSHVDHVGGGHLFKQQGIELLGHREMLTPAEGQWEAQGAMDATGGAYRMDGTLADGRRIQRCGFTIDVLHTPGHTRGCLSYLVSVGDQRCLFSGDVVMSDGLPGWAGDEGHDPAALVASLKRLAQVPFDHMCYGHGVILEDRGELFRQALDKHAAGAWFAPGNRYALGHVAGRQPAAACR